MVIFDVKFDTKYDQSFQNSCQKQSMSSKYDCVLHVLIILLGNWKFEYNLGMNNYVDLRCPIWYQRQSNPPKFQSWTINILQVWLCNWYIFNLARELTINIQLNNDIWWLFVVLNLISNTTKSSKYSQDPSMSSKYDCILDELVFMLGS